MLAVRHDEAAVIRVAVRVGEQGGQPAMNLVERRKALQIHIEHHVSVQQQKIFVQPVPDAGTARPAFPSGSFSTKYSM